MARGNSDHRSSADWGVYLNWNFKGYRHFDISRATGKRRPEFVMMSRFGDADDDFMELLVSSYYFC